MQCAGPFDKRRREPIEGTAIHSDLHIWVSVHLVDPLRYPAAQSGSMAGDPPLHQTMGLVSQKIGHFRSESYHPPFHSHIA